MKQVPKDTCVNQGTNVSYPRQILCGLPWIWVMLQQHGWVVQGTVWSQGMKPRLLLEPYDLGLCSCSLTPCTVHPSSSQKVAVQWQASPEDRTCETRGGYGASVQRKATTLVTGSQNTLNRKLLSCNLKKKCLSFTSLQVKWKSNGNKLFTKGREKLVVGCPVRSR